MQKRGLWRYVPVLAVAVLVTVGTALPVMAVNSSSENYQLTETEFGGGSALNSCSGQYCARASIGDMNSPAPGESSAAFNDDTGSDPLLEVIVDAGESNLGVLTTEQTASKTTTVRVRNHMSGSGYLLQIIGEPPKFEGHTLKTPTTPTASKAGEEQFAINVAANTAPNVGAMPVQVPADQTIFGVAAENYNVHNMFMYRDGDTVGRGLTETGRTDYTVSMIVNISSSTPAGHYSGDFLALVVPAF